ncbi:MAG: 16S rRNA pseudouridine(516) synthase, partial [Saezia sp.]
AQKDPDAELGLMAEGALFTVDGKSWPYYRQAYIALHKPVGYECSQKPSAYPSVYMLLPSPLRNRGVQAAGRLDADTTGLLLFSDDGQFIHRAISGKREIPKVYRVVTKHEISAELIEKLLSGVQLDDEPAPIAAAACEQLDVSTLLLTITTGKYHQVKRMIAAAGNRVEGLHREAVGKLALPETLKVGEWCWVRPEEVL